MADSSVLSTRWDALWAGIGEARGLLAPGPDPDPPAFEPIAAAYCAPGRHYHNLDHIAHCLAELDPAIASGLDVDPVALELALWFHDVVYDPTRADNAKQSARGAAKVMKDFSVSHRSDTVTRLISLTRHDHAPKTPDGRLMVDIDLSILGQRPDVFDAYDRAIRREYAHVDDGAFAAGRAKVLRQFLDRPAIYQTAGFRERYEQSARENLQRAVMKWD